MAKLLLSLFLSFIAINARAYERIVILAPALSEWTAEILGEQKAKQTIVAVSEYSIYPAYLKSIPTIGAYMKLNAEKISALKPDLVLGSVEYTLPEQVDQLKRLKLPLVLVPKETFSQMPDWIRKLGSAIGDEKDAEKVAQQWSTELHALKKSHPVQGVVKKMFLEIQHSPLVTIGSSSFLNEAFSSIGYENVFHDLPESYPKVSKEAVLKAKPDTIFILDLSGKAEDFAGAKKDWETFSFHPKILPGDDFARCSFSLLKGLQKL